MFLLFMVVMLLLTTYFAVKVKLATSKRLIEINWLFEVLIFDGGKFLGTLWILFSWQPSRWYWRFGDWIGLNLRHGESLQIKGRNCEWCDQAGFEGAAEAPFERRRSSCACIHCSFWTYRFPGPISVIIIHGLLSIWSQWVFSLEFFNTLFCNP